MNTKLIVLAAATVCGLTAQDPMRQVMANVPFGFETNGVKMAAGTYVVTAPTGDSIVKVRNVDVRFDRVLQVGHNFLNNHRLKAVGLAGD